MACVVGLGFVGSALLKSFKIKKVQPLSGYDKFKDGGIGSFEECLTKNIMFICLPTPYNDDTKSYGKESIKETMKKLSDHKYPGLIVLKSTVEPGTTEELSKKYPTLSIVHNPEFLSAATAFEDFHNQKHAVIGRGSNCTDEQVNTIRSFYRTNYADCEVSVCLSMESESMKSFVNCFYALKIQFFNELYLLCEHNSCDYDVVKELMLKNKWINPMHTTVPGRDGKLSYGGGCFPKDTNALLQHMKRSGTPHAVLQSCIEERNSMRIENDAYNKITPGKSQNGLPETDINANEIKPTKSIHGHTDNGDIITNGISNGIRK